MLTLQYDGGPGQSLDSLEDLPWTSLGDAQLGEGVVYPVRLAQFVQLLVDDAFTHCLCDRGEPHLAVKCDQRERHGFTRVDQGVRHAMPPAYGFADAAISVPAGGSGSVSVSAQDVDYTGHRVSWSVTDAAGLTIAPTSGVLEVRGPGIASQPMTVTVPPGTPAGRRDLDFAFVTETGRHLLPATTTITITTPTP